jgi:hypothetical protein
LRFLRAFRFPVALFAVVAMVLALTSAIDAAKSQQGNKDAVPSISIAINLRQDAIISDAEKPLEVTITNISNRDQPYLAFSSPLWMDICRIIDIRDSDGKPAPEKPILTRINGPLPSGILIGGPIFNFKPGEQMRAQVLLNRLYDLSKPGKYTIMAQTGGATSNTITASFVQSAAPARRAKPALSLTLKAPSTVVRAGSQVPVELAVKNISRHEITLAAWRGRHESGPGVENEFGTGIVVSDSRGNRVPLTKSGRVLLNEEFLFNEAGLHLPGFDLPQGEFAFLRMRPDESREEEKTVGELYDLSKPGTYTIQASLMDPISHLLVKSNTVVVTVIESSSLGAATSQASPQAIPPGVSLAISGPRRVMKAGSQVWLKVSLSNHSPENIGAPGDDSGFCATIDVYDEKGAAAPDTEFGRQCKQDMLTVKVTSDTGPIFVVRPGGTWTGKVEVTKLVDISRPGKYTIQMHYGRLLSNKIVVTELTE